MKSKKSLWNGEKFRPVKPASPHLNGKVERSQRADLDEFYSSIDIKGPQLDLLLAEWEFYYNWHRPHSSLAGKTPNEKHIEMINQTPLMDEVSNLYDPKKERIIMQNYQADFAVKMLKQCL